MAAFDKNNQEWLVSDTLNINTESLPASTFKIINLVPVVGWIPLLILLVGIDEALKIILIAKATARLAPQDSPDKIISLARIP